jgi:hypothetical protein
MRYLSPEWFAAAQAAIDSDGQLRERSAGLRLTIEQTVTGGPEQAVTEGPGPPGPSPRPGSAGEVIRWHVVLDHGSARLVLGPAPRADLRFRASYAVAAAIARGDLAAPIAFVRGQLTVGGDLNLLSAHQRTLAALHDVLRDVRRATSYA